MLHVCKRLPWLSSRLDETHCFSRPGALKNSHKTHKKRQPNHIVKRLDPDTSFNELRPKPKGTHGSTYECLSERYHAYDIT